MQPLPSGYPQQGVVTYPQPQYVQGVQPVAGQTIIIQTNYPSRGSRVHDSYPAKASKVFGGTQLTIGILLVILNIVAIAIDAYLAEVGHGFWCGLFFIITGAFGLSAGKSKTTCPIVTFMVLSILSALLSINVLTFSAAGAACDSDDDCYDYYWTEDNPDSKQSSRVGVGVTMALLGGIEGIVAIISSALCCAGLCCSSGPAQHGTVIQPGLQYVTTQPGQNQQQVVYLQGGQPNMTLVAGQPSTLMSGGQAACPQQPQQGGAAVGAQGPCNPTASAPPSCISGPPPVYSSAPEKTPLQ